jgi:hypothetical protein
MAANAHYSALYGAPAGVGVVGFGIPVTQLAQRYLFDNQINVDNQTEHLGVPGAAWNILVNGVITAGSEGLGSRIDTTSVAPGSSRMLVEAFQDKSLVEWFLGAGATLFSDNFAALNPFLASFGDAFRNQGGRLQWEDFQRALTTVPIADHAERTIMAINAGKYFDKNGLPISNMTPFQTTVFAMTGIAPPEISDYYSLLANERAQNRVQTRQFREMQFWFNKMLERGERGDFEGSQDAARRIETHREIGGWSEMEGARLFQRLLRGQEDAFERVLERYGGQSPDHLRFYEQYRKRQGR